MVNVEVRATTALELESASIQAVVFDLGGVLTSGLEEAMKEVLVAHGVSAAPQREVALARWQQLYIHASLGELSAAELWRRLRRDANLGWLPAGQEDEELLSHIHLKEAGIPQTLARLQERYPLGLLSNHVAPWAHALLDRLGLTPFFEVVVISSEVGQRKPAGLVYRLVCEELNVPPGSTVYIADEEEDLLGCQAAGMFPIFIPGEDSQSDVGLEVGHVSDLLDLL